MKTSKKTFSKILAHTAVFCVLCFPLVVFAQGGVGNTPPPTTTNTIAVKIDNPFKGGNSLMSLITSILNNVIMPVAAVAVVMWIIWAGFGYLRAQGKPAEIAKANQNLLWSLIGAGILLGAAAISAVVQRTVSSLITPTP